MPVTTAWPTEQSLRSPWATTVLSSRHPLCALRQLPRRAIAESGGLVASGAVFQASIFLANVLIARALGRAELGRYAVAIAIGSVVVSGAGGGLPIFALRETAAGNVSRRFALSLMLTELRVTASAGVVAAVVGWLIVGGTRGLLLGSLAGFANVALSELSMLGSIHAGLQQYGLAALGRALCGIAIVLLTVGALALDLGVSGALGALALAAAAGAGLLMAGLSGKLPDTDDVDCTRLFARSRSLIGVGMVYGGYQRIDVLIVLTVTTASTAGLYAAAYRVLGPFTLLASGFGTVFFSRLSALPAVDPEWDRVRRRGLRLFCWTVLPIAATTFVTMPQLVKAFFGAEFADATGPARVLLVSLVPYVLYLPNAHALNAARRERPLLAVLLVSTALEAVLLIILSQGFGAIGAAWAWVATECCTLAGISALSRSRSAAVPRE